MTMPPNPTPPSALKQAAEAATPGPWTWEAKETAAGTRYQHVMAVGGRERNPAQGRGIADTYHDDPIPIPGPTPFGDPLDRDEDGTEWVSARHGNVDDARYIALANPTAILALLAQVDELAGALEALVTCFVPCDLDDQVVEAHANEVLQRIRGGQS